MKNNSLTFFLIFSLLVLTSCSTVYYVGETTEPVALYSSQATTSTSVVTIPRTKKVLIKKRSKTYPYIIYETYHGYSYKPIFIKYHKFKSSTDGILYGYSTSKTKLLSTSSSTNRNLSSGGLNVGWGLLRQATQGSQ